MRTALKETAQKGDALPDRKSSETDYGIVSIVLMVIVMGIILLVIIIVVIVKKDHIYAWIQSKRSKSVPKPVQVTSPCDGPNSTSYQLVWNKPDDQYLLQKYILRYCEIKSIIMEHGQPWPLGLFLSVVDIPASAVSYTLSPLTPGRCYQVEIQAINKYGQSCSKSFYFKTKESVPQPVQVKSHRDSPDSTSYQLIWDKPDDGGSELLQYIIRYCEVEIIPDRAEYELSRSLNPFHSVDTILPSALSCTLSPLAPGRYYLVEIQAINTQGRSLKNFIFKTKEGTPQPVQVISHRDSPQSESYKLMWDKPDDGGSQLLKYILRYCEVEIIPNVAEYELSSPISQLICLEIPPSDVSYTLKPLTPGSYYQVEVQAVNTMGMSSKSFIFKTKELQNVFQLPVQLAPCPTPAVVTTDETYSKFPRLSRNIESLKPRNSDTVVIDIQSVSEDEQKADSKLKKRSTGSVENIDSESDDEFYDDEIDELLKDHVDQNF
ncbi:hypothetical protein CHS0354_025630 [Potamilus streckersoni]|uniref:Fibronectin type-III domain-containing protein n=2 Tax=Potamilus streckersoni TaxID=2493646 RepID=A0AAE0VMA8_9BIVA|nr:hypothetical protein CHS0354_025630 [Potamilus streckersoni]